jgi:hypothetical protein
MKSIRSKKGSAILPTLLIIMIIVGSGFTYVSIAFNEFKLSFRNQDLQGALNLAEAGIEEAMNTMKHDKWSSDGWTTIATDNYYKEFTNINLRLGSTGLKSPGGRTGSVKVYASVLSEDNPIIFAEGRITSKYGTIKKQIRTDLGRKGLFLNGMTAKDRVVFNGNKISIDSYNSDNGLYNVGGNRKANGTIGSLSTSTGALYSGNANVFGKMATGGGDPSIGAQGILSQNLNASAGTVDTSLIAKDFIADFPDATPLSDAGLPVAITTLPSSGTIGVAGGTTYYKVSSFSSQSNDLLKIEGEVIIVVTGDVSTKGEIQIQNNGVVNMSNVPENFQLFGTASSGSSQTIKVSGNGAIQAAIYAPNADIELKGSGSGGVFMGAAVGDNITMTGNFEFHYDEALANFTIDKSYRISRWRELIESDEKVPMDTPKNMVSYAVSN